MTDFFAVDAVLERFCRNYLRRFDGLPIRGSEFKVLGIVCCATGACVPVELAHQLGVSRPMITMCLATLERGGFVARVPSPADGRSVYIVPTKRGKDLVNKYNETRQKYLYAMIEKIGVEKFEELVKLLGQLNGVAIGV